MHLLLSKKTNKGSKRKGRKRKRRSSRRRETIRSRRREEETRTRARSKQNDKEIKVKEEGCIQNIPYGTGSACNITKTVHLPKMPERLKTSIVVSFGTPYHSIAVFASRCNMIFVEFCACNLSQVAI